MGNRDNFPNFPSKDLKFYGGLIKQMTLMLGISIVQPQPAVNSIIFNIVQCDTLTTIALLLSNILLQAMKIPAWISISSR